MRARGGGTQKGLEGKKGKETWCNHSIISKNYNESADLSKWRVQFKLSWASHRKNDLWPINSCSKKHKNFHILHTLQTSVLSSTRFKRKKKKNKNSTTPSENCSTWFPQQFLSNVYMEPYECIFNNTIKVERPPICPRPPNSQAYTHGSHTRIASLWIYEEVIGYHKYVWKCFLKESP